MDHFDSYVERRHDSQVHPTLVPSTRQKMVVVKDEGERNGTVDFHLGIRHLRHHRFIDWSIRYIDTGIVD